MHRRATASLTATISPSVDDHRPGPSMVGAVSFASRPLQRISRDPPSDSSINRFRVASRRFGGSTETLLAGGHATSTNHGSGLGHPSHDHIRLGRPRSGSGARPALSLGPHGQPDRQRQNHERPLHREPLRLLSPVTISGRPSTPPSTTASTPARWPARSSGPPSATSPRCTARTRSRLAQQYATRSLSTLVSQVQALRARR